MAGTSQAPGLQDKLKEQVTASVKDALERTTTILSNLHRVQSYLDIVKTIHSGPQGLKNAMQQVRTVRNDVATLLQTVYLAEISIQSLQDYDKSDEVNEVDPTPLPSILPMLDVADMDPIGEVENRTQEGGVERVELQSNSVGYDTLPPAKRSKVLKPDGEIGITECSVCGKKFANPSPASIFLCRVCRQSRTSEDTPSQSSVAGVGGGGSAAKNKKKDPSTLTPRNSRGSRGSLSRMSCKLCGASFIYKRCLHRHIRENHSDIDMNNLAQYIQVGGAEVDSSMETTPTANYSGGMTGQSVLGLGGEENENMLLSISEEMGVSSNVMGGDGNMGAAQDQGELSMGEHMGGPGDKYVCSTCNKTFDRPYRLQRHIQVHNPNRPKVTCHVCDKSFTRMDTLENHMKCLHSNDRPFQCTFTGCPKRFPLQSALVHHLKVHMDGKPYKCNECDHSFALLGEFRIHMAENHSDTKDLRCTECYKVFPSASDLAQHIKLEHRLECEVCMKTFSRLAYLQAHIEVHNGQSLFNCRYCMAGFDSEYAYKKHLKSHPKTPKSPQSHLCAVCDLAFESTAMLMGHYRSDEHRNKMQAMGLEGTSILHTIEGELSPEIRSLVDEVTGSIGAAEVDERLMHSMNEGGMLQAATVTIEPADTGREYQEPKAVQVVKKVRFHGDEPTSYTSEGKQR